jgi:ubiquitin-protein ligase
MSNTGAQFVKNYLNRDWRIEQKQDRWTIMPNQENINKVLVLYNFTEENGIFKDMQLVFEIAIHEEHPYKAPSIKTLTPNGRTQINQSICIDGLTAWHPESWKIVTSMNSIIERFLSAFIDVENIEKGVGFIKTLDHDSIQSFAKKSREWNWAYYPELILAFHDQITDYVVSKFVDPNSSKTADESDESEINYVYSDDES